MNFSSKLRHKYLQSSYRPRKSKSTLSLARNFFNEIEEFLTPDSEKKSKKEKGAEDK